MFDDWFEHVILLLLLIFILVGMYGAQPGIIVTDIISVVLNVFIGVLRVFVNLAASSIIGLLIAVTLAYFLIINRKIVDWNGLVWIILVVAILVLVI
ncbi:MAG: hypothetical protein M1594_00880 [Candidatus Marsarchaeota archaeon]|nr:hypothetical protein [Candidatus Marsarchaeota archaeon]